MGLSSLVFVCVGNCVGHIGHALRCAIPNMDPFEEILSGSLTIAFQSISRVKEVSNDLADLANSQPSKETARSESTYAPTRAGDKLR